MSLSTSIREVLPGVLPLSGLSSLPVCSSPFCPRPSTLWQRWWARHEGVWLQQRWYCSVDCFQFGLYHRLEQAALAPPASARQPNRMPLGLVLLSQGDITAAQLREALKLQKTTRSGKLGEWLVRMGAVTERQVMAALAMQQRCPVFPGQEGHLVPEKLHWPEALVCRYRAVPVFYNPSMNSLYVGFLEQVDHGFLYALERMLLCRTLPCIVPLSTYRQRMESSAWNESSDTIAIPQRQNGQEMAQTIGNYAQQINAERCSFTVCHEYLWIRLETEHRSHVDFLFRAPAAS